MIEKLKCFFLLLFISSLKLSERQLGHAGIWPTGFWLKRITSEDKKEWQQKVTMFFSNVSKARITDKYL